MMPEFIHICGSLKPGGIKSFVTSIVSANNRSHSKHIIAVLNQSDYKNDNKLQDISICGFNPLAAFRFAKHASYSYEKIFIHTADYLLTFSFAFYPGNYYFFQHGMAVSHGNLLKKIFKRIWFSVIPIMLHAKIICSSEFAFQKTVKKGVKLQEKRKVVIPFGTIMERKEEPKINYMNEKIIIGSAGRLAEIKRFDKLIFALKDYKGRLKIELSIAGEGPEKEKLKRLINELKNDLVSVNLVGNVADMKIFFDEIDLFLFPSHNESFGLVVLESLFRNTPVVLVKDVGGALSLIENEFNGFILENLNELNPLLEKLNKNKLLIKKMSRNISRMDLSSYKIQQTRKYLEELK